MIKCIAIDDEPLALQQIARYIERIPDLELCGTFYSVDDAKRVIESSNIDIVFLDIEMPDCNGVDFAHQLGDKCPFIIFTTAYPQYAIEGFRLDAIDYLLKPLSFEEMQTAVAKAQRRLSASHKEEDACIYIKESGSMRRINAQDILYVKGLSEYVQIVLRSDPRPVVTFERMKHLEQVLEPHNFMRVHKSYLINLNAIDSANTQSVTIGDTEIPISETYRSRFSKYLKSKLDT